MKKQAQKAPAEKGGVEGDDAEKPLLEKIFSPTALMAFFLILALAGYVLFQHLFFAFMIFVLIIALFVVDVFYPSKGKKSTLKQSAIELGVALAAALIGWIALCFVLNTSSPLNVVTSCSMVPVLERGDFIVLEGGEANAPEVKFEGVLSNAALNPELSARSVYASQLGKKYTLYYSTFVNGRDVVNYNFQQCVVDTKGGGASVDACLESAAIGEDVFYTNKMTNDVIVYEANPDKYGLVIHRVLAKIRAWDGVFYLTKGDNNLFADQQSGISLVPQSKVKGKVLARVPYLGFLKLFLFMQFEPPPGCDQRVSVIPQKTQGI